jgi:hypothetical protein
MSPAWCGFGVSRVIDRRLAKAGHARNADGHLLGDTFWIPDVSVIGIAQDAIALMQAHDGIAHAASC